MRLLETQALHPPARGFRYAARRNGSSEVVWLRRGDAEDAEVQRDEAVVTDERDELDERGWAEHACRLVVAGVVDVAGREQSARGAQRRLLDGIVERRVVAREHGPYVVGAQTRSERELPMRFDLVFALSVRRGREDH